MNHFRHGRVRGHHRHGQEAEEEFRFFGHGMGKKRFGDVETKLEGSDFDAFDAAGHRFPPHESHVEVAACELVDGAEHILVVDRDALAEEEKYDGYYAIVTSELDKEDEKIIEIYRGLWKIEDSFRVTKSDLETRPVYVSRENHIEAHFLICFVALVLLRLLEKKLEHKHPVPKILESLRRSSCSHLEENMYLFDYYDQVLADIGEIMGIDFSRKYRTAGEIKKIFGGSKKNDL